jgi:hypothetical protein
MDNRCLTGSIDIEVISRPESQAAVGGGRWTRMV